MRSTWPAKPDAHPRLHSSFLNGQPASLRLPKPASAICRNSARVARTKGYGQAGVTGSNSTPRSILKDVQPASVSLTGPALPAGRHADKLAPPAVRLVSCSAVADHSKCVQLANNLVALGLAHLNSAFTGSVTDTGPERIHQSFHKFQVCSAGRYLLRHFGR